MVTSSSDASARAQWREWVPHRDDVYIDGESYSVSIDMPTALAMSCDTYFYELGKRFYDLNKSPTVSPYTGEVVDIESVRRKMAASVFASKTPVARNLPAPAALIAVCVDPNMPLLNASFM